MMVWTTYGHGTVWVNSMILAGIIWTDLKKGNYTADFDKAKQELHTPIKIGVPLHHLLRDILYNSSAKSLICVYIYVYICICIYMYLQYSF